MFRNRLFYGNEVKSFLQKTGEVIYMPHFVEHVVYNPGKQELIQLINRKNKLVKQLNNTLKVIDSTTKALGITGGIIETLNIAFQVIKNLPLPSASLTIEPPSKSSAPEFTASSTCSFRSSGASGRAIGPKLVSGLSGSPSL